MRPVRPGLLVRGSGRAVVRRLGTGWHALCESGAEAKAQGGDGGKDHGFHRNSPSVVGRNVRLRQTHKWTCACRMRMLRRSIGIMRYAGNPSRNRVLPLACCRMSPAQPRRPEKPTPPASSIRPGPSAPIIRGSGGIDTGLTECPRRLLADRWQRGTSPRLRPSRRKLKRMVGATGIEPVTPAV